MRFLYIPLYRLVTVAGIIQTSKGVVSDCNSATIQGFYTTNGNTLNLPNGATYGILEVSVTGVYIIQRYYSISSNKIFAWRTGSGSDFVEWIIL